MNLNVWCPPNKANWLVPPGSRRMRYMDNPAQSLIILALIVRMCAVMMFTTTAQMEHLSSGCVRMIPESAGRTVDKVQTYSYT